MANIEAMWAARCLKFNAVATRMMIDVEFPKIGLQEVADTFSFKSLTGKEVLLKEANVWELLNIPIDDATDLFIHLLKACQTIIPTMTFDKLFSLGICFIPHKML